MIAYNFYTNLEEVKEDNEEFKTYLQMDQIMKKLFTINNPRPIIDLLNAIYADNISYDAKLRYNDKEIINKADESSKLIRFYADMYITVIDGNNVYEYALEFQTIFDKEIAIRVFRYSFERAVKLADYSKSKECIKLKMPEPYIILIEEEEGVKDRIKLEIEFSKNAGFTYEIKILRYWTYGLEQLYKENMYLLYPLQIFKLRKNMKEISSSNRSQEIKESQMLQLYEELKGLIEKTLQAIDKAYEDGKIDINDYDTMNTVIENLNSYFLNMYGKYRDLDKEVSDMVKSFYDPKVEEKGKEEGKIEGKKLVAKNMLLDGEDVVKIKKYTGLSDEDINKIKRLIEGEGNH